MWFGVGLAGLLWGATMLFDRYGPTERLDAVIISLDTSTDRRGQRSYSLEGVDERGGEFDTGVSRDVYDRADRGDRVVVERALVTNRVVVIDGGGWRYDGSNVAIFHVIVVVVGGAMVAGSLASMHKRQLEDPESPTWAHRTRWVTPIVLVALAGWIVYERWSAGGDAEAQPLPSTTVATTVPPIACDDLGPDIEPFLTQLLDRGSVLEADVNLMIGAVSVTRPDCTFESVETAVCTAIADASAATPSLTVSAAGRCPDLP